MRWSEIVKQSVQERTHIFSAFTFLGILIVLFFTAMILLQMKSTHLQIEKENSRDVLAQQFVTMNNHLGDLSQAVKQFPAISTRSLEEIRQQLHALQQNLATVSSQKSLNNLLQVVINTNQSLLSQWGKWQQTIMKQQIITPSYLPKAKLPFKVVSIDSWNDEPEATIMIGHTAALMSQGDSRAGWTLTALSFEPAEAIFQNQQNKRVKVTL